MTSFRKAINQAKYVIARHQAIGRSRHWDKTEHPEQWQIHSLGTARNYQAALARVAAWLKEHRLCTLASITPNLAIQYLAERSEQIQQKTLNQERQALQLCLQQRLPVIHSEITTITSSRAYSPVQIQMIAAAQTPRNRLATEIAYHAGLRAHELLTLRPIAEQPRSTHRQWSSQLFREVEGQHYSVIGKGGLIREVVIPTPLTKQLEALRLKEPLQVADRSIHYQCHYDLGGGQPWSNSFSRASQRILNWSHGAHGLRHSFAQERMNALQQRGFTYFKALELVSQLLGHFRPEITEVYLR